MNKNYILTAFLFILTFSKISAQTNFNQYINDMKNYASSMHFCADKSSFMKTINDYGDVTTEEEQQKSIQIISVAYAKAQLSEDKYISITTQGEFKYISDSLNNSYCFSYARDIMIRAYNLVNSYICSDKSTYTEIDSIIACLSAYDEIYSPVYQQSYSLLQTLTIDKAKNELQDKISEQTNYIQSCELLSVESIRKLASELHNSLTIALAIQSLVYDKDSVDFTEFIRNPDAGGTIGNIEGWNIDKGNGDSYISNGEHYSGNGSLHYFNSYNPVTGELNYTGQQLIKNVPNGTYSLTFACRTNGDKGSYVFAQTNNDTTMFQIPVETYTTCIDGVEHTSVVYNTNGSIWENAKKMVAEGSTDPLALSEAMANDGRGFGWHFERIDKICVRNHVIIIGMGTNSKYKLGPFNGTWFSVDNFRLVRTAIGDNSDWKVNVGTTNILIDDEDSHGEVMYNLSGERMSTLSGQKGIFIIRHGCKARKVLVK